MSLRSLKKRNAKATNKSIKANAEKNYVEMMRVKREKSEEMVAKALKRLRQDKQFKNCLDIERRRNAKRSKTNKRSA